jgi:hypothetical protein
MYIIKTEKKGKHLNTLEKCHERLHINDTYADTYNPIFETLHQMEAHTPQLLYKHNQFHNTLHNIHTAHLLGKRHTET